MQVHSWQDCWFDSKRDFGDVVLTKFNGDTIKYTYKYRLINSSKLLKVADGSFDTYISLNSFKNGHRKSEYLNQIRNIGVDCDIYKMEEFKDLDTDEAISLALEEIDEKIEAKIIPEPNLITYSHGIQLIWSIDGGLPASMTWATRFITETFINKLADLGADSKCVDPTRIFRVPTSVNTRTGLRVNYILKHEEMYKYSELSNYVQKHVASIKESYENKTFPAGRVNQVKTNVNRVNDLIELAKNRGFNNMVGYRNTWLFWYAFSWLLCNESTFDNYVKNLEQVQIKYIAGLSSSEIRTTLASAWQDALRFRDYYEKHEYKIVYVANDGIIKPAKTDTLLKQFEITLEEQSEMKTLATMSIKKERHNEQARNRWRKLGAVSREEYNNSIRNKKSQQIKYLKGFLLQLPKATKKHVAWLMKFSRNTLYKTIKTLGIDDEYIDIEAATSSELLLFLKSCKKNNMLSSLFVQEITNISKYNDYDTIVEFIIVELLKRFDIDIGNKKDRKNGLICET